MTFVHPFEYWRWKKIRNVFSMLCFIVLRKVKTQLKCIKRFVQCVEKVLWLIKCVKSGLWSFLLLLIFWPNNYLLWGCLMHWKMFSSTPGLSPPQANSQGGGQIADILKISKSIKLLVKMKNVSFISWRKPYGVFGQPQYIHWLILIPDWGIEPTTLVYQDDTLANWTTQQEREHWFLKTKNTQKTYAKITKTLLFNSILQSLINPIFPNLSKFISPNLYYSTKGNFIIIMMDLKAWDKVSWPWPGQ